jgi:ribosomal-protein-alanine N-acetyltransferase
MLIRPATSADIQDIVRLEQDSPTASHWSSGQYDRIFTSASAQRMALVIEEADSIQGFLIARAIAPEWEIENIAIAADARRRGLATQLLKPLFERARAEAVQAMFLEVRESNHAARALYEKWSFVESGRRAHYYENPQEDAITYRHLFA